MKKNALFKNIMILVIIFYIIVYVISISSYYDYQLQRKTILTSEQIKLFEEDISEGKDVSLNDYVIDTRKDYSSNLTKFIYKISSNVNRYIKKGIEVCFKLLNSLVSD